MKVLLLYTNRNRAMAPSPIGLAYLSRALKDHGHEVRLVNLMFSPDPVADINTALQRFCPDYAGVCIRNVDEQDMLSPSDTLARIRPHVALLRAKGVPIILGGTAFTTFPREMLAFMEADYGIAGQGEVSLPRLIVSLESGQLDTSIAGLTWRQDGEIRSNPPSLSGYAGLKADWDLLDHPRYRKGMFQASVLIKSGCSYRCSYCDVLRVFGDRFVKREVASIIEDIRHLRERHEIRVFFLTDPCFNAPLDFAKEVLEAIIEYGQPISFSSTFAPVTGHYDSEFFDLYRRAGGTIAVFGIEGLCSTMLESYAKPFTMEDVLRSTEIAHEAGIKIGLTAMFGGPGESEATIREAMRTLGKIPFSFFTHFFGLRIAPHTPLFEQAKQEGLVSSATNLFEPTFYLSPELDLPWARRFVRMNIARYAYRYLRMPPVGIKSALARRFGVFL